MCAFININQQKLLSGQVEVDTTLAARQTRLYYLFFMDNFTIDNMDQFFNLVLWTEPLYLYKELKKIQKYS